MVTAGQPEMLLALSQEGQWHALSLGLDPTGNGLEYAPKNPPDLSVGSVNLCAINKKISLILKVLMIKTDTFSELFRVVFVLLHSSPFKKNSINAKAITLFTLIIYGCPPAPPPYAKVDTGYF